MKNKKCVVCGKNKARRTCELHNNKMVCSLCCAQIRNSDCEGCQYFKTAKQYHSSKTKKSRVKHFVAEINEEVENAVDQALALVEKGDINSRAIKYCRFVSGINFKSSIQCRKCLCFLT